MKFAKIITLVIFLSFLVGCVTIPVTDMKLISTILTTGGEGERFKRKQQEGPFKTEDTILMLTTLKWDDIESGAGKHKTKWIWYSSAEVVSVVERDFIFYQTPFELRGYILGSVIGPGEHKVELFIDDQLFETQKFSVVVP